MNPIGKTFGRLTVLEIAPRTTAHIRWVCHCACGEVVTRISNKVMAGTTSSCGCLRREVTALKNTTHGLSRTPAHSSWLSMLTRCRNQNFPGFYKHGGRGITVCDRWLKFENFLEDMGHRPEGTTLDRINNDGNYEPGNCRWATIEQQNTNTRQTHHITFNGETLAISQWEKKLGIKKGVLRSRILRGWPEEEALTRPIGMGVR